MGEADVPPDRLILRVGAVSTPAAEKLSETASDQAPAAASGVTWRTVMLVGYDFIQLLIPAITSPFYYATAENHWGRMHPYLPAWLVPRDPAVIRDLFRGESAVPWRAWIGPLSAWGVLILSLCAATLSLNVLASRP